MTSRQRVLESLNHRRPDRIPIDFWAAPEVYRQLQEALSLPDPEAVLKRFDVDLRYFNGPDVRTPPPDKETGDHAVAGRNTRCPEIRGHDPIPPRNRDRVPGISITAGTARTIVPRFRAE